MRLPLTVKIAVTLVSIILVALALTLTLNYLKFERTLRNVTESRLGFIAADLDTRIEAVLDLGLELSSMNNVEGIIAIAMADEADLVGIDVFDGDGVILYSTQQDRVGTGIDDRWRAAYRRAGDERWEADDPANMITGTTLTSNFGAEVGGIALRYPRVLFDARLDGMLRLLVRAATILIVLMAVIGAALTAVILTGTTGSVRRVRDALDRFIDDPATARAFEAGPSELETEYASTEATLRSWLRPEREPSAPIRP